MTRLLLVRHGETDWNAQQRFQGQDDQPLNERGRRQARALQGRLAAESPAAVYASDLRRATETAAIVGEGWETAVTPDPRLREISFGAWEGLTYGEIQAQHPAALAAWEADVLHQAPPGGETVQQFAGRVQAAFAGILAAHPGAADVVIVAHGGVLQLIICAALNLPPTAYWQFRMEPASLSEIAFYPAGAILNRLNETSHWRQMAEN